MLKQFCSMFLIVLSFSVCMLKADTENEPVWGWWGYIDTNGTQVISPCFIIPDIADFSEQVNNAKFSNGIGVAFRPNRSYYFDKTGKLLFENIFAQYRFGKVIGSGGSFSDGLASVGFLRSGKNNYSYGYINLSGQIIIKDKYLDAHSFKDRRAIVEFALASDPNDHKIGIIDTEGKLIFTFPKNMLPYGDMFSCGLLAVKTNADQPKYGFIDTNGKVVIDMKYSDVLTFSNDRALCSKDGKIGFIDKSGTMIFTVDTWPKNSFSEDLLVIYSPEAQGYRYIDKMGKVAIPGRYKFASSFSEGLAAVMDKGEINYKYINKKGQVLIPATFEEAGFFKNGRARVKINGLYGFINTKGELVIAPQFKDAGDFSEGMAFVNVLTPASDLCENAFPKKSDVIQTPQLQASGNINEKIKEFTVKGVSFRMCYIPSTEKYPNGFYLSETEVTQQLYKVVMGKVPNKSKSPEKTPATNINWKDAKQFCNKLASMCSQAFRLPTEEEWDYACKANTTTDFFWGNDQKKAMYYANTEGGNDGILYLGTTKQYNPNSWGLYDMIGNLWEFMCDSTVDVLYNESELMKYTNTTCILRGGSCLTSPTWQRKIIKTDDKDEIAGIRIALPF